MKHPDHSRMTAPGRGRGRGCSGLSVISSEKDLGGHPAFISDTRPSKMNAGPPPPSGIRLGSVARPLTASAFIWDTRPSKMNAGPLAAAGHPGVLLRYRTSDAEEPPVGTAGGNRQRRAWASRRWATASVTFSAVGMWRNSLGPWALLPGPSTPVMTNWASGSDRPSIPMNGIVPPSPT